MKSINKLFLAAMLLTGVGYAYAKPATASEVNNNSDVQYRHLSGFNAIDVSGSFNVVIVQGGSESVKVVAPADMMSKIITELDGGVLKIHARHGSNWSWSWWGGNHKKVVIYVTASDLNNIAVTGSGDVDFKSGLHTATLRLRVSGSGDVLGKLDVTTLETIISGSGDVKLSGHAQKSTVSVSGSGDYNGRGLVTMNTAVRVSGSGDASINASDNVDAAVSGSGDVSYSGGVKHISQSKSGSGDISRY